MKSTKGGTLAYKYSKYWQRQNTWGFMRDVVKQKWKAHCWWFNIKQFLQLQVDWNFSEAFLTTFNFIKIAFLNRFKLLVKVSSPAAGARKGKSRGLTGDSDWKIFSIMLFFCFHINFFCCFLACVITLKTFKSLLIQFSPPRRSINKPRTFFLFLKCHKQIDRLKASVASFDLRHFPS